MKLVRLLSLRIVIFKVCEGGLNSEISSSWLTLFLLVCKKDVHVHLKHVRDIQRALKANISQGKYRSQTTQRILGSL